MSIERKKARSLITAVGVASVVTAASLVLYPRQAETIAPVAFSTPVRPELAPPVFTTPVRPELAPPDWSRVSYQKSDLSEVSEEQASK